MVFWQVVLIFFLCASICAYEKKRNLFFAREASEMIQAKDKKEYLRKTYSFLTQRFAAEHLCWLKYPLRTFWLGDVWNKRSIPCNVQNSLFQHCLQKRFNKKEIKTKWIIIPKQAIIHCYSLICVRGKWIPVDVWGAHHGIPFGEDMVSAGYKR